MITLEEKSCAINSFVFNIKYNISGNEITSEVKAKNRKAAYVKLCSSMVSIASIKLDELFKELDSIKIHYLDSLSTPYLGRTEPFWSTSFWTFLEARQSFDRIIDPEKKMNAIEKRYFGAVIPSVHLGNRTICKDIFNDLQTAIKIFNHSLSKLRNYDSIISVHRFTFERERNARNAIHSIGKAIRCYHQ